MSDSHEEQLLSDLLTGIAREDARLDAAHLEARVMKAAAEAPSTVRLSAVARWTFYLKAAAAVVIVLLPGAIWMTREVPVPATEVNLDATEQANAETTVVVVQPSLPTRPAFAPSALRRGKPTNLTNPTIPTTPTTPTNPTNPTNEFVALMPMTEQELAGPFQIVRVQMPRASLGTLRSPLEHPNELVEADVLLGQDGMARAIRVSTSGSVYPWRSR